MFYIQEPDGSVAFHILEEIVFTRLEYLESLYQGKTDEFVGNIEYLLEDSKNDSIGHFILRLISRTSMKFFTYWLTRETIFFKYRINNLSPRQLHRLLRKIIKHIVSDDKLTSAVDKTLIQYCSFLLKRNIFYHIIDKRHFDSCEQYHTKVDFELILDLMKTGQVELCKGQGKVYCSQWKEVLVSLFQNFINQRVYGDSLQKSDIDDLDDPRLISLNMRIQSNLSTKGLHCGILTYENINDKTRNFPLCMRNLHIILRKRHRLSHHARFYYTLFLKECGMKIDDIIRYWKEEYSKPHLCNSVCTHNWQNNERKFIYSIRHMYGLEGNRKNYKVPTCRDLCKNIPGPNYEGGCPFSNFDRKRLHHFISSCIPEVDVTTLLNDKSINQPEEMCKKFLRLSINNIEHNFKVTSPDQYFMRSIK